MAGTFRSPARLVAPAAALVVAIVALGALWLWLGSGLEAEGTSPASARPEPATATKPRVQEVAPPLRSEGAATGVGEREPVDVHPAVAPRLRVRVLGAPDRPLPGAAVTVFVLPAEASPAAPAHLVADDQGACSLEVRALEGVHPFELTSRAVLVRASCPGWRPHEWRLRPAQLYEPGFELRAVLQPGGAVLGRVVDAQGRPLGGASVTLLGPPEPADERLTMLARTSSAADGTFQAGYPSRSSRAVVLATHSRHGAARRDVALVGATTLELGDLSLEPAGVLEGRVVFPDGSPARRAQVLATALETSRFEAALPDATAMPGGRVEADEQGRFRFALLAAGVYRLDVGNPYTVDRTFAERRLQTFRTPASDLLLQADHVALCVRVVDRAGRALAGVGVEARRVRSDAEAPSGEPRGQLRLLDKSFAQSAGDPPVAILALDPGDQVVLRATLATCYPAQELVAVDPLPGEQQVTLEVFSRAEAVQLRPRVLDSSGRATTGYAVDLYDPYTRLALRTDLEPDEDGLLPALAPGPCLLRVRTTGGAPHTDGPLPDGLGTTLRLRPGGTQQVELRLE